GIPFNSGAGGSVNYAIIRYGGHEFGAIGIGTGNSSPSVTNSSITDNNSGISISNAGTNPTISGNTFSRNGRGVLIAVGSSPTITGNSFDAPTCTGPCN